MGSRILVHWRVSGAPSFSPEFSLPASSTPVVVVIAARQIKPNRALLRFKLQRLVDGKWRDEQEASGAPLSGTRSVQYVPLHKSEAGERRLEVVSPTKDVTAEVNALLADGQVEGLEVVQHPIEEL